MGKAKKRSRGHKTPAEIKKRQGRGDGTILLVPARLLNVDVDLKDQAAIGHEGFQLSLGGG
jgi:hypothetical protein